MHHDIDISVIIRIRDEEFFLPRTLSAVMSQDFSGTFEIVIVDNCSADRSTIIARQFTPHILTIEEYTPGKALNMAIEYAHGNYIAVLSAHTIPANSSWLRYLHAYMNLPRLGGVYGAQLYPFYSKFLDKRDLDIFSTLKPRVETHDTDFWNANSMFPRSVWEELPFDEHVFELEDHYWTKLLTPRGYRFYFEPQALVYHYSHVDRIDREHLSPSPLEDATRITEAVAALEDPTANWPDVMQAGLILSSLTNSVHIHQAIPALTYHLLHHDDFDVRWRMAQALGKIRDERTVESLIQALNDPSFYPRDEAAWSLAKLGVIASSALLRAVNQLSPDAIIFAALALGRSAVEDAELVAVDLILEHLRVTDLSRLCNTAYFAGEIACAATAHRLVRPLNTLLATSRHERLEMICCWALGELGQHWEDLVEWNTIREYSAHGNHVLTRFEAVIALGKRAIFVANPESLFSVIEHLTDSSSRVRFAVMQSVRRYLELVPEIPALTQIGRLLDWHDNDNGVNFEQFLIRDLIT